MSARAGALGTAVVLAAACGGRPGPAVAPRPAAESAPAPAVAGPAVAETPPRPAVPGLSNTPAAFRTAVDSILADPKWAAAQWGVLVVNPRTGDTLYSRNAGKLFLPASNQKIITGAVALARLGADYRWRTAVAVEGLAGVRADRGVVRGDLYVVGSGDPTVSEAMQHGDAMAPLRLLADSIWARGVRRIEGDVVAREDPRAPDGPWKFGWEWDDLDTPSGAGVTELLFNEGVARVAVYGGARAGAPARVVVRPTPGALPLDTSAGSGVRTVAAADSAAPRVSAAWDYDARRYHLRGAVAAGDSVVVELGVHDPRRAYAGALADALRARGIVVDGRRDPGGGQPGPAARLDTLAVLTSAPLRDVLPAMEKPSQNQIAEALFLTLGRSGTGVASGDSARRVVGDQLRAWGAEPERDAAVRDGSGLSRHDYASPAALVRVLDGARRLPGFRVFYDALPVAGVDGTLGARLRGTRAAGRVHAKTGSIDRVRGLSGYAATADDELLVFSLLCNNFTAPAAEVTRAQDAIAERMAELRARDPRGTPPFASAVPR
ncbi:peptidase M15 [Gemmatimonadetes bacterium T265]|nr:peptidase M15 [Gemmatimonadetes bacterium T265]